MLGGQAHADVADPVAEEEQHRGGDDGGAGPRAVQRVDGEGGSDEEGEEEGGAEPVNGGGRSAEVEGGRVGDGGEGEPLQEVTKSAILISLLWREDITYIPAHDDVQQDQLYESEPPPLVHSIHNSASSIRARNSLLHNTSTGA